MSKNIRKELVEKVIELIENNESAWQKTWSKLRGNSMPYNPITNKDYRGANLFFLKVQQELELNTDDPRWCTYKQAQAAGYQVVKGSKGSQIIYYDIETNLTENNKKVKEIKGATEKAKFYEIVKFFSDKHPVHKAGINSVADDVKGYIVGGQSERLEILTSRLNKITGSHFSLDTNFFTRGYTVFNYSQMDNVPELIIETRPQIEVHEQSQAILDNSTAKIFHDQLDRNYYSPPDHEIHLTLPESFESRDAYYSTALHELAHWSKNDGVERNFENKQGDFDDYSREELRAEMASIFMGGELGLDLNLKNHSAYVGHYLKILKEDHNEFYKAIADAEKISDHLVEYSKEKKKELSNRVEINTEKYGVLSVIDNKQLDFKKSLFAWRDDIYNLEKYSNYVKEYQKLETKGVIYEDGVKKSVNREISNILNKKYDSEDKSKPFLFSDSAYGDLLKDSKQAINGYSRVELLNEIVNDLKQKGGSVTDKDVLEAATSRFNMLSNEIKHSINVPSEIDVVVDEIEQDHQNELGIELNM